MDPPRNKNMSKKIVGFRGLRLFNFQENQCVCLPVRKAQATHPLFPFCHPMTDDLNR